ncbi:MAG: hypothetical protein ACREK5_03925 [Gemmatimonadota bacterium]
MLGTHLAILALLWAATLAAPTEVQAQRLEDDTYEWQFLVRGVSWEAIQRLQDEVRDYREESVIGHFEIRITQNGALYDALVLAAVIDAEELARLREFVGTERALNPEPSAAFAPETERPPGEDRPSGRPGLTRPQPST